jgi:hypothetical protein
MKSKKKAPEGVFTSDPPVFLLKDLTVRVLEAHEYERAGELLDQEHYLGDLRTGRALLQAVEYQGHWVALLDWGSAALKLADREQWIGWSAQQRAERLKLVAMNRRFLVLGETRMPNLASRSLALAVGALPEQWKGKYGYSPVLAETFSDIEQFEGTCYKAAGWRPLGLTRGFARHRMDYYREHGRPKRLWVKPLNRNARRILTGMDLPPAYSKALNARSPERDLPLKRGQLESLRDYLREHFEDPRRNNRTFQASSLLAIVAMALFAGRDNLAAIQRYGQFLTPSQREWLSFPRKKNAHGRKAPSYTALRNLLIQIDPQTFAACLSGWLQANLGTLPRALAIDGKWIRDRALSLCLSDHETGAPVAVDFAANKPKSEAHKREGEQTVALRLYQNCDLENATVTGDALNNNKAQAAAILQAGGDYFFQLKDENRHAHKAASKIAETSPLLPISNKSIPATDASTNAQ